MSRLGKLLFGLAVAGATAATVYNYLDQKNSEPDEDFDDDLTPFTTASEESFTDTQCRLASAFSCFLAGGLMIAVSFVI